ncbi:sulfotransferase domain-containing protein [Kiloniella laminariae]|uniref:Sulfotransferase domain-containing protein n=1 Tax=Kiloniella laminariae TaxID=454162 RepID=A0ABT4LJ79_9PROT|nr:sulfotransferase domain-containing protein [Kiloniella laminariae]MCZ4281164.1 sulfotransferase domain-containing protein [Kiloniella laminariae]
MPGILWLASYPKSGNTWMRTFLANLIADSKEPLPVNKVSEICSGEANTRWYNGVFNKPLEELSRQEIADIRVDVQRAISRLSKNVLILKTHNFLGEYLGKPLVAMDATGAAVYIVRDPRDVAISAADHFGVTIDKAIKILAKESTKSDRPIYEVYNSWSNHVKSWTQIPHKTLMVYRYEDMLEKPEETFGAISRKLGITKDEARIQRAITHSSFKVLQTIEEEEGFTEKSKNSERFFRAGKSGQWQSVLTDKQVKQIEKDHGHQMKKFGYL